MALMHEVSCRSTFLREYRLVLKTLLLGAKSHVVVTYANHALASKLTLPRVGIASFFPRTSVIPGLSFFVYTRVEV